MKKLAVLLIFLPCFVLGQNGQPGQPEKKDKKDKKSKTHLGIGLKAGLNFSNITNAKSFNNSSRTGFMAGVFIAPPSKSILSSRTELIFSRQGYDFKTNTANGNVNLNYLIIPQLMGINITKYVQLQLGFQMAYLLNAKADSTSSFPPGNPAAKIMDYYNRFDYGAAGGIEIHPVSGLLIGARYNVSFGDMYKNISTVQNGNTQPPSFFPSVDAKNNVVQIFIGWQF